jgi:hypothetical protein
MRAHTNTPERFWSMLNKTDTCWLWTGGQNRNGYGQWSFRSRPTVTHRIAWMLTHGPIPEGMQVLHRCDVRLCCNPDHLFLGTTADNMRDKTEKGRQVRGEAHWARSQPEKVRRGETNNKAKLTDETVLSLRARYKAGGISYRKLAVEYGLNRTTVLRILQRKLWAHT